MPSRSGRARTWADVRPDAKHAHAAAPPAPSADPAGIPVGGVFIHYRGPAKPLGDRLRSNEDDCRRDIAGVYEEHTEDDDFNGDIGYNFLICQHGNIYQGRGYERGEANTATAPVDGIGRNAGFYSICALMRSNHTATEAMLRPYRGLIQHLRDEAPRRAGTRILPHSFQYRHRMPGQPHRCTRSRARPIDPAAPWTGWPTSTSSPPSVGQRQPTRARRATPLPRGRPHRLVHGAVADPGPPARTGHLARPCRTSAPAPSPPSRTATRCRAEELNAEPGPHLQRRLWCKGYWTSTDQAYLERPTRRLRSSGSTATPGLDYPTPRSGTRCGRTSQGDAADGPVPAGPGGDINIRGVQQRLNSRYVAGVGIPAMAPGAVRRHLLPRRPAGLHDGHPVRARHRTRPRSTATSAPAPRPACKGRGSRPLTGDLRYLFRAACYFNSPVSPGDAGPTPLMYDPPTSTTDDRPAPI